MPIFNDLWIPVAVTASEQSHLSLSIKTKVTPKNPMKKNKKTKKIQPKNIAYVETWKLLIKITNCIFYVQVGE